MASEIPAKLPYPDGQPIAASPGQPIMYHMAPGRQQPGFTQVPQDQPATMVEEQPIQNFQAPINYPVQPGQPGQPVFGQGTPGQPVQSGQPGYIQGIPGQPVQARQPVYIQGTSGQPLQLQQQAGQGGFDLSIDTDFLKSPPCFIKIAEFVALLGAWASIIKYIDIEKKNPFTYEKADVFKGITIFSWVVVIINLSVYTLSLPKVCKCKRPSLFTITSVVVYFILFSVVLASTANLVPRAVDLGTIAKLPPSRQKDLAMQYVIALDVALAFGFLSSILFFVDMVLNYRVFQIQRAQEIPPEQAMQGPPQRRVWDINYQYTGVFRQIGRNGKTSLYSSLWNALLFGAWVCILKYFDWSIFKDMRRTTEEDSKADFFKGITIWAWVMVILLVLTVIFSFDKIGSRSSPWTLMTLIFYVLMSILLIACCGNLTPRAVDFGKVYKYYKRKPKQNILALLIGLGFGYIAWITFIFDIVLIYNLYRKQRMEEFRRQQLAGQPVIQQAAVVVMSQNIGEGAKQQVFQPTAPPGQQPFQNPGQQSVVIGSPPPYNPPPY